MTPLPTLFVPAVLRETAGDDDALVRELLQIFLRVVPLMTARLHTALDAGHAADTAHEAHALRSCLSIIGATEAETRCRHLESAARASGVAWSAQGATLCADLEELVAEVRQYAESNAAASHQPSSL